MARLFVDSNVWVYAVDDAEPRKRDAARAVLARAADEDIVISAQVLGEFYVTVRRRFANAVPEATAAALVDQMRHLPVVAIDSGLVASAIALAVDQQVSYWDGLILAAAAATGCETLLSEDLQHGQVIAGVRIENPFLEAAPG